MDKRKLHYLHNRYAYLKPWYFLVPVVIFGLLTVQGLRSNYTTMVELRQAVYTADQENTDVEGALTKLRAHVYGHMNTNLTSGINAIKPPIQLKARYERLAVQDKERVKQANAQVNAKAEQLCGGQFPQAGFNAPRVACIQDYVGANAIAKERSIPDQLYKFDFVSPRWSPDLAGLSIVLTVLFAGLFVVRVAIELYIRRQLKQ